jgi:hypothetical protein
MSSNAAPDSGNPLLPNANALLSEPALNGRLKRMAPQGLVHWCPFLRCASLDAMSSISWKRIATGSLAVLTWQFIILAWFLVGQGYDRSTAMLVAWSSWALVPVVALLLSSGIDDALSGWKRHRQALLRSVLLSGIGVWVPAMVVVGLIPIRSPFAELWWTLVGTTLVSGALLVRWQRLASLSERVLFGALVAAGILGWRQLLFSFF